MYLMLFIFVIVPRLQKILLQQQKGNKLYVWLDLLQLASTNPQFVKVAKSKGSKIKPNSNHHLMVKIHHKYKKNRPLLGNNNNNNNNNNKNTFHRFNDDCTCCAPPKKRLSFHANSSAERAWRSQRVAVKGCMAWSVAPVGSVVGVGWKGTIHGNPKWKRKLL